MERIPCRRCLLKDLSDTDYFHSIYEYIENIPPEQKPRMHFTKTVCKNAHHATT